LIKLLATFALRWPPTSWSIVGYAVSQYIAQFTEWPGGCSSVLRFNW